MPNPPVQPPIPVQANMQPNPKGGTTGHQENTNVEDFEPLVVLSPSVPPFPELWTKQKTKLSFFATFNNRVHKEFVPLTQWVRRQPPLSNHR